MSQLQMCNLTVLAVNWCFFPPTLPLEARNLAGNSGTGVLGASLAVSDWSVVVVSAHATAAEDTSPL